MKKLLFIPILLICSAGAFAQSSEAEALAPFKNAMNLLAAKQTDEAIAELKRVIELDGDFVVAHIELQDHVLQKDEKNRPALIDEYRRRVEEHPDSPVPHYLLGRLLEGAEAKREFEKSIELDPKFFWGRLGLAYFYAGDLKKMESELDATAAICPNSGDERAQLALALFRGNLFDRALEEFDKAKASGVNVHLTAIVEDYLKQISGLRAFNQICFLAHLLAALICTVFFVWALKFELGNSKHTNADALGLVFFFYCCVWFYLWLMQSAEGNLLITGRGFNIWGLFISLCNSFWPALVYHLYFADKSKTVKLSKIYSLLLGYFYGVGIVLSGVFAYSFFVFNEGRFNLFGSLIGLGMKGFLANMILCAVLIVFTALGKSSSQCSESRSYRQWEIFFWSIWLFVLWPVIIASVFGVVSIKEYGNYLQLFATMMPLAFVILGVYYEARFAFVDLFIKKSAVFLAVALTAVSYYVFVIDKFAQNGMWRNIKYPEAILLLPLAAAIPLIARLVERFVDRFVFKRAANPSLLLSGFSRAIRFVCDEERMTEVSKRYLTEIFSTENVAIGFARESDGLPMPGMYEEFQRTEGAIYARDIFNPEAAEFCKRNDFEVVVPLIVEDRIRGCVALGKRNYSEPYLSEDLNLLNSLADQLEFAIENIDLEKDRREQILKEKELKILAGRAELRALRAQINPHFLFNALNTIASLIRKSPAKAEETVETLADVFRYTLAKSGADFIPLSEDLEFIKSYLEIEKARFGDKLRVEMKIAPQAENAKVPSMILQPLVENALKHGILPKVEGGTITISASCENGLLMLSVADDGVGFNAADSKRLFKEGFGLKNVRDRLKAIYGGEDRVHIRSAPDSGTEISIEAPIADEEPVR